MKIPMIIIFISTILGGNNIDRFDGNNLVRVTISEIALITMTGAGR